MRSASTASSQRTRSASTTSQGKKGGLRRDRRDLSDAATSERSSSAALVPKHKPLGSAERSEEDRQLHQVLQYELERKALRQLNQTCPFQPRTNHNDPSRTATSASKTDAEFECATLDDQRTSVEERLLRKAKAAELIKKERQEAKERQEQEELNRLFKPQLNEDDKYRKKLLHPQDLPVEERLLHYGKTVEESRRQLREDREAFESKQLLEFFRPSTSQTRKKQMSFLTRAETRLNDRDKAIGEARAQQAKEYTFQPSISRLSQQMAQEQRRAVQNQDRAAALHEEAQRRRHEKEKREREQAAMEADRRAYHPTTNPSSEAWIQRGQHRSFFGKDFVERQDEYTKLHEEHAEALQRAKDTEQRVALEASRATTSLARVRKDMIEQQVERLYYEAPEVSKEVKERLAEQLLKEECPFAPTLSIGSEFVARRVHRQGDVVERLTTVAAKKRCHSAPASADSSLLTPARGGGKTVDVTEAAEFYRRQVDSVQRTHEQLSLKQSEQQLEEQLECTFRPRTNVRTPTPQKRTASGTPSTHEESVTTLQGVSEFLKRRELAKKLADDKEAREHALGKGLPCNGPNFTVVVPFKLSDRKPVLRSSALNTPQRGGEKASNRWNLDSARLRGGYSNPRRGGSGGGHKEAMNTSATSQRSATRYDDRVPRAGFVDPYNSERLLAAIRRYNHT